MNGFRALAELAQLGATAVAPNLLAGRALQIALEAVGADGGDLCLLEGYQRHVLHSHWPDLPPAAPREPASPPDPLIEQLLADRRARAFSIADAPAPLKTLAGSLGYARCASTPIYAGGRPVGVLDMAARRADAFPEPALEILTAIGAALGPVLDQALGVTAAASHELAQNVLELRALQRVAETVSRSLDLDEVLGRCLDMALQVAHAPAGAIYLRDDQRKVYERVVARNVPSDVAPPQVPATHVDERFHKGPPQLIDVDDLAETHPSVVAARRHGFRRIIIMPLRVEGRLVGLLGLDFHEPTTFVPSTVLTLEAIAGQEAVAIENARAHRVVEVRARVALILREFGERALVPDGDDLNTMILGTALKLTRSDRGLLALNVGTNSRVMTAVGKDAALVGMEVPVDAPYLKEAAEMNVPLVIEDTGPLDPKSVVGHLAHTNKTASFVLIAMRHRGHPRGYLFTGSGEPRRYDAEEIEAMQILASMAAEVIERGRVQAESEAERRRFEITIEHLPVVVSVINNRGEVLNLNAAGRAFAVSMGRDGSTDWRTALSELRYHYADGRPIPPMELPVVQAFAGQTPAPLEMILSNPDGSKRLSVMGVAAPLSRAADGTVEAVVAGFQDVTALRELADAKDRFLRVASHELRSPITSLRATTSLLEMDPTAITDEKRRATMLQRIQRQVDRLIKLVEQLIDSARLNAKEVPIHPVACDLVELARESIALARSDGPDRQITLCGDDPLVGQWDPLRIEQVLTNLILNACRYSPADREIIVRARADGALAVLEVIDRGIGIPEDQIDKMFSPFFRASNAVLLHRGGLGLGLHIASELVRRHGGQIRVASHLNEGSTFTVELPRARP
jgi:signal transduction histidine kinase/putative methionine-R-sulfoxide reductase with GAF domain